MDKVVKLLGGSIVTPLKRIYNPKGDIFHGLKVNEDSFKGFGEAYFSSVFQGETKGWKCHREMTLNLIVPIGAIEFHLRTTDGTMVDSIRLGEEFYGRLTVPPGVWLAFSGLGEINMLLNIASIPHNPEEAINKPLDFFPPLVIPT